jgi:hypothetical protein
MDHSVPMTEEEDEATLAAIDRGIQDADAGRVVSAEEARQRRPDSEMICSITVDLLAAFPLHRRRQDAYPA